MTSNHSNQSASDFAEAQSMSRISNEPGWFLYDALNKVEPLGRQLKPWDELNERAASPHHSARGRYVAMACGKQG